MTEQQYRVHACNNTEPHDAHEFRGTYRKPSLPGVEITETFQCEGIERPVPTTDEAAGSEGSGEYASRDGDRSSRPGEQLGTEHQPSSPIRQSPPLSEDVPENRDQIKQVSILLAHIADPDSTVTVTEFAQAEAVIKYLTPHPPTREQIAKVIDEWWPDEWTYKEDLKDRLAIALVQNGADR